jgi:hypothetical protein
MVWNSYKKKECLHIEGLQDFICNQHAKYSPDITPSNMWIFCKGGLAK